jgi:hypothetical protein
MNNAIEAILIFIVFVGLLVGLILYSERQQRLDSDKAESNIMQMRQDIRLACYLLVYIGILLAGMFAFMVYKLL